MQDRVLVISDSQQTDWFYEATKGVIHLLILAVPVLVIFWKVFEKRTRERAAESWPSVSGRIVAVKVLPIEKSTRHMAILSYAYFVESYESGEYEQAFPNAEEASRFIRKLRDREVVIRYDQANPAISVLEKRTVEQIVLATPDI